MDLRWFCRWKRGRRRSGAIYLVVDSAGLKIFGEGELLENKHKVKAKRKSWRKLHLGLDLVSGDLVRCDLTTDGFVDSTALPGFLDQIDGGVSATSLTESMMASRRATNFCRDLDKFLARFGGDVQIIISPPKNAILSVDEQRPQSAQSRGDTNRLLEVGHRPQNESMMLSQPKERGQNRHAHLEQNERAWLRQV